MSDALNAGEDERASNEANRKRFHQQRLEAKQRKMVPVLRKAKAPPKEPIVQLNPESPEGMLFAELTARLACRGDDGCLSEGLQRIRRYSDKLLPSLPKLMSGQEDQIVVEALKMAGLFKVRTATDAVSRTLMLGEKVVQEEAVWALGAIGDARGIEPLRRFSTLDNPPRVMAAICRSLGQIGTGAALDPIDSVFKQGTVETRVECLDAASRVGGERARGLFERAMKDPRPVVADAASKHMKAMKPVPEEAKKPGAPSGE